MKRSIQLLQVGLITLLFSLFLINDLKAQVEEPEVVRTQRDITTLTDKYGSGFGININMNNFGFGVGAEYRRVVASQSEIMLSLGITGLRDESEQTFTDFFFGQQTVPNKFQRGMAFPLMAGFRQRVFSNVVQENYRFFVSASVGPVAAYTYPYFNDPDNIGFRFTGFELLQSNEDEFIQIPPTQVNDIFSGMGDGDWHWGAAGEIKLGVDIGSNFSRLSSIEFGYYFYYFTEGIQMMQPKQPSILYRIDRYVILETDSNGDIIFNDFFEPQKFFGTPQITFTFGWLW